MLEPDLVLRERYRIVSTLGRGGMGAVYLATDLTFGSTVAIKQTLCEGADLEKAFQREARLLNGLRHPALPVVIDYFTEARGQFLVMQYIPGDDFGALLDQRTEPFGSDLVLAWADQLLEALQYLHEHDPQVIHRDIKPRNLKLTPRGEVVLLDFGLSKSTPVESPSPGTSVSVLGYTPHYAPFEQIQGQGTDPRSDLFALAATLYHLLTATLPPDAMVRALATMNGGPDPLQPAHAVNPAVPVAIGEVLHAAMAMGRDRRPPSAAAMRTALRAAAGAPPEASATAAELPTIAAPGLGAVALAPLVASQTARTPPQPWARPWAATVGVVGMVGVLGLVVAAPGRGPRAVAPAGSPPPRASSADAIAAASAPADDPIPPAERTFAFEVATLAADGRVARTERESHSYREDLGRGVAIEMVAIPGGSFEMGNAGDEYPDEMPQHTVTVAPFYLGRYEVTQAEWRAVAAGLPPVARALDPEPSAFEGDDRPVEQVSWEDAVEFAARVARKTGHAYRLPSEAEWEYAARAGTTTAFAFGAALSPAVASYDASVPFAGGPRGSTPKETAAVGSFGVANPFGLADVHGNVAEWCLGEYHPSYAGAPADGRPWVIGGDSERRVVRGGSWDDLAIDCRSANRYAYARTGRQPTIGFRLAMSFASRSPTKVVDAAPPADDVAQASSPIARAAEAPGSAGPAPAALGARRGPVRPEHPMAARRLRRRLEPGRGAAPERP